MEISYLNKSLKVAVQGLDLWPIPYTYGKFW
jgi:hypothetical protein